MSTGALVAVAVVTLVAVIRVSGHLTRQIATEARAWCGVCGIEIADGWVLFEVVPSADDPPGTPGRRTPRYFCRGHRPTDARVMPWHAE